MNPFDKNFVGQIPTPSRKERGHQSASRKMSARLQTQLDRDGPAQATNQEQRTAAAAKTARISKASI